MSSNRLFSPLSIVVVLFIGFLIYLNIPQAEEQRQGARSATPVIVERIALNQFPISIEALGTAIANESVDLTAKQTEIITELFFDDGDVVEKGQLLVQLNQSEELARIEELEASIDEAKRQLERVNNLAQNSAASQQLLDEQSARVKVLEAQLDVAKAQLGDLKVRAPFAGILGIRQVSVGSLVRPADVITSLDDISVIKVDFSVAENNLASLSKGQKVFATSVAYPGVIFEGTLSSVDTRIDPVSRSVQARAIINNSDTKLRPGMLLQIRLEKEVLNALTVDERALVPIQDRQYVYIVEEGKVVQAEVVIGERKPGRVQIISGIAEGQEVIVEGTLRVQNQTSVRILEVRMANDS